MKRSDKAAPAGGGTMWGGRFRTAPAPEFVRLGNSFGTDWRLLPMDIAGSVAWAGALRRASVISPAEERAIVRGLKAILAEAGGGARLSDGLLDRYEDVHSFVEAELVRRIGPPGLKLHTGRSRNDQVALDLRLYLRAECQQTVERLTRLMRAVLSHARRYAEAPMPAFTHLRHAQPVLAGHWWLAWFEMLMRDAGRFVHAGASASEMPLGSGAVAGGGFGIDRAWLARKLRFPLPTANSLDAVGDRDFALDYLHAAAVLMVHLSRLAEEAVIFSSPEFGYLELDDSVTSGSSLMPQKKNPDTFELVRGKSGRTTGNLVGLLTVMKGVPLAYNRDLQEDKEAVFDSADTVRLSLDGMAVAVETMSMNTGAMAKAAGAGHANATELADHLVRRGMPFRQAHETAGQLVLEAEQRGVTLSQLPIDVYRHHVPAIDDSVLAALSPEACLASRDVAGGTAPHRVAAALASADQRLRMLAGEPDERA